MNKNKGFTLIELLVVIAIIGILASVVLASLNSARNKGADAAVKTNLANARAQAEMWYDDHSNAYTGLCASGAAGGINSQVLAAAKAVGVSSVSVGATATTTNSVCNVIAQEWGATAPLKNPVTAGNVYCVDSTGFSGETAPANVTAASPNCS